MDLPKRLPAADPNGSYWFGSKPGDTQHPAIIKSERLKGYVLSLGPGGMIWRGKELAVYETPQQAFKELRKLVMG